MKKFKTYLLKNPWYRKFFYSQVSHSTVHMSRHQADFLPKMISLLLPLVNCFSFFHLALQICSYLEFSEVACLICFYVFSAYEILFVSHVIYFWG
jgi:hypothetical protein